MEAILRERLRPFLPAVLLCVATLLFGFGLGGAFGAKEDAIKGHLKAEAAAVLTTTYAGDAKKAEKISSKSWVYLKRAHMHAGGLGAATLALVLLLALLGTPQKPRKLAALALGIGGLLYPIFWLLAGLRAPGLGSTGAAKESLSWLALPGVGLLLVGTATTFVLTVMAFRQTERS